MEENKEVMNTEQAGSGGMLYGTEPQPQEELHGISAAYSTEMQAQPSELPQPIPVQQPITPQQQPAPPFNPGWSGQPPQQGSYYQQGSGQPMNNPPMGFGRCRPRRRCRGRLCPGKKAQDRADRWRPLRGGCGYLYCGWRPAVEGTLWGRRGKSPVGGGICEYGNGDGGIPQRSGRGSRTGILNKMKAEHPVHTNMDLSFTDPNAAGSFNSMDIEIDAVSDYKKRWASMR